jgi:hypothetical protein
MSILHPGRKHMMLLTRNANAHSRHLQLNPTVAEGVAVSPTRMMTTMI